MSLKEWAPLLIPSSTWTRPLAANYQLGDIDSGLFARGKLDVWWGQGSSAVSSQSWEDSCPTRMSHSTNLQTTRGGRGASCTDNPDQTALISASSSLCSPCASRGREGTFHNPGNHVCGFKTGILICFTVSLPLALSFSLHRMITS